jgi:hypothetical protein
MPRISPITVLVGATLTLTVKRLAVASSIMTSQRTVGVELWTKFVKVRVEALPDVGKVKAKPRSPSRISVGSDKVYRNPCVLL